MSNKLEVYALFTSILIKSSLLMGCNRPLHGPIEYSSNSFLVSSLNFETNFSFINHWLMLLLLLLNSSKSFSSMTWIVSDAIFEYWIVYWTLLTLKLIPLIDLSLKMTSGIYLCKIICNTISSIEPSYRNRIFILFLFLRICFTISSSFSIKTVLNDFVSCL